MILLAFDDRCRLSSRHAGEPKRQERRGSELMRPRRHQQPRIEGQLESCARVQETANCRLCAHLQRAHRHLIGRSLAHGSMCRLECCESIATPGSQRPRPSPPCRCQEKHRTPTPRANPHPQPVHPQPIGSMGGETVNCRPVSWVVIPKTIPYRHILLVRVQKCWLDSTNLQSLN